jgi:hypothetical protein
MAKHKHTIEVDTDKLGVASRHHFLMANDEEYRASALTPPGGKTPDVELPDDAGLSNGALAAASAA